MANPAPCIPGWEFHAGNALPPSTTCLIGSPLPTALNGHTVTPTIQNEEAEA